MRCPPQEVIHLNLRGRQPHPLVRDEEDWRVLSTIAERTLFWCGGSIHACRCEGRDMSFAVEMGDASVGTVAHHISAPTRSIFGGTADGSAALSTTMRHPDRRRTVPG